MGKKKGNNDKLATTLENQNITLREENIGKKQINVTSMFKLEHLQKLAIWASGESSIPPLAALFGQRLAASAEIVGVPLDRALFICQRCETVLQPGENCTVRIESNHGRSKKKGWRGTKNSVVYACHFCSQRNLMRGTFKGCVKELLQSQVKRSSRDGRENQMTSSVSVEPGSVLSEKTVAHNSPLLVQKGSVLGARSSEADNGREKSVGLDDAQVSGGSSKRKRKRWSSLRDIAEKNDNANQFQISNLVIPLTL